MTRERDSLWSRSVLIEIFLLLLILAGATHSVWTLKTKGYLPQPFIWDPNDTFMDWYNPAYWAHREGIYSVWRAVYPPLSFAILQFVTKPSCYISSSFVGRDCDGLSQGLILVLYLVGMMLSYRALRQSHRQSALPRTFALTFGLPGLYLLERGNLLILCQIALAIIAAPQASRLWVNALCAAVMINLKPYLLLPVLAWGAKRNWRQVELAGFATVGIFCLSWAIVGSGSPLELAANTLNWTQITANDVVGEMYYTTSFNSMFGVFDRGFPILKFIGSREYELMRRSLEFAVTGTQLIAFAAIAFAVLRPRDLTFSRIALLILLFSLIGRSPGGYSELLVVFLVFLEPWRRTGPVAAIIIGYLISIPYEFIFSYLPSVATSSWLTGHAVIAQFGIGVGQFVRPFGLLLVLFLLALDTIVEITNGLIRDHHSLQMHQKSQPA